MRNVCRLFQPKMERIPKEEIWTRNMGGWDLNRLAGFWKTGRVERSRRWKRRLLDTLKGTLCIDFADEQSERVTCNSRVAIRVSTRCRALFAIAREGGRGRGWVKMGVWPSASGSQDDMMNPVAGGPIS